MTEENKSQAEAQTQKPKFPFIPSADGIFEIYANLIDANWTLYDVRVRFAQIIPNPPGSAETWRAEERAAMTVSWGYAKTIRDALSDLIARYEKVNGEITVPKLAE
jgi:hypothetical protein